MIRNGILFPLIFIVCQVLTIQFSQSHDIVWAADREMSVPNINTLPPEDENGEQVDEDESMFEEDDKPPLTEDVERDLSTDLLGETDQNETRELISELKNLEDVEDPVEKLTMVSKIMEENGKLPPKTTETLESMLQGDTKAIGELCNILSEDSFTNIEEVDCSKLLDQSNDTVGVPISEYGPIIAQLVVQIIDALPIK